MLWSPSYWKISLIVLKPKVRFSALRYSKVISLLNGDTLVYFTKLVDCFRLNADPGHAVIGSKVAFLFLLQSYVLMLYSTLSRSQYDFTLPQVTFTSSGYHKHVTLTFNPTVRYRCFFFLPKVEPTEYLNDSVFCGRISFLFYWQELQDSRLAVRHIVQVLHQNSIDWAVSLGVVTFHVVCLCLCFPTA